MISTETAVVVLSALGEMSGDNPSVLCCECLKAGVGQMQGRRLHETHSLCLVRSIAASMSVIITSISIILRCGWEHFHWIKSFLFDFMSCHIFQA